MRICLISSSFYPATFYGGPISSTWGLSKEISTKDIEMYVSTTNANGISMLDVETNRFIKKRDNFFVKYYYEEFINRFSFAFIFGIWFDIKKADIVYIQYLFHYTVLFSLLFSILQRKRVFVCPRGSFSLFTLSNSRPLIKGAWISLFVKPFHRFIQWQASSNLEKNDIKRILPDAKVHIISDGVDFASFQNFQRYDRVSLLEKYTKTKFKDVSNIFFSMGRLHTIKAFDVLISAFSLFVKEHKDAKLIIAGGDDGAEEDLHQQILDLKLEDSVFLIGAIGFDDKKILLNNCDYFSLASDFESFGIVVAEALCCGKPIVVSDKTPWQDLQQNQCGFLVNNDNVSFYYAFLKVIEQEYDPEVIRKYVVSNYDWSIIANRFLNVITKE